MTKLIAILIMFALVWKDIVLYIYLIVQPIHLQMRIKWGRTAVTDEIDSLLIFTELIEDIFINSCSIVLIYTKNYVDYTIYLNSDDDFDTYQRLLWPDLPFWDWRYLYMWVVITWMDRNRAHPRIRQQ